MTSHSRERGVSISSTLASMRDFTLLGFTPGMVPVEFEKIYKEFCSGIASELLAGFVACFSEASSLPFLFTSFGASPKPMPSLQIDDKRGHISSGYILDEV